MRISLGSVVRFGGKEGEEGLGRMVMTAFVIVDYLVKIVCLLGVSAKGAER